MCKICGNNTVKKTISKLEYDFCPVCGFLSKDESYFLDSKSEYERYLKHDNDDNAGYYKYQEKFYNSIKDYLGKTNLDFGCGYGKVLVNILNEMVMMLLVMTYIFTMMLNTKNTYMTPLF